MGALSEVEPGKWSVTGRPWTYNMNELVTACGFPADDIHITEPFDSAQEYLKALANLHIQHLWNQPNVARSHMDAQRRYIARHLYLSLIKSRPEKAKQPYKLFCDDMRPANMIIDRKTWKITAVIDFEFTNALPAGSAHSPPWWLLLTGPDMYTEEGNSMDDFVRLYEPRLEQFLRAMRIEEQKCGVTDSLSTLVHQCWTTGAFWHYFAARKSLDIDELFYEQLDRIYFRNIASIRLLGPDQRDEIREFVERKMEQKKAYDAEFKERFPNGLSDSDVDDPVTDDDDNDDDDDDDNDSDADSENEDSDKNEVLSEKAEE